MAESAKRRRRLSDGYGFEGFRARQTVRGVFGDPQVRIVSLDRRSKKRCAAVAEASSGAGTTGACARFAICPARATGSFWSLKSGVSPAGGAVRDRRTTSVATSPGARSAAARAVMSVETAAMPSSESVRKHQAGLQSFRSMRRIDARRKNDSALRLRFSQSFASRRQRLSHAMVRSTTQRRGRTTKPLA